MSERESILYQLRTERGLSVAELAKRSKVAKSTIYDIERRKRPYIHIQITTAFKLARGLGMTPVAFSKEMEAEIDYSILKKGGKMYDDKRKQKTC